jgi:hypothetical protein
MEIKSSYINRCVRPFRKFSYQDGLLLHLLETLAIAAPGRGEFNQDGLFVRDSRLANVGEFGSNFRPSLRRGGVRPRCGV